MGQGGTDLANMFYSVLTVEESQAQFAFTLEGTQFTFMRFPMAYLNSPAIAQNLYHWDLNTL